MSIMFNYLYALKSLLVAETYKLGEVSIFGEQYFHF